MKLDIQFKELEILVSNMGASAVDFILKKNEKILPIWTTPIIPHGQDTGDIDIESILQNTPNDTIFEQDGRQFLVYIKEIKQYYDSFTFPKFHFYKCQTLERMQRENKFDKKYVATERKNGEFYVDIPIGNNKYQETLKELNVCKHCLKWYNNKYRKNYSVDNFNIVDFFEQFKNTPINKIPIYNDKNAPPSGYTDDWNEIATNLKERKNWTCEQCGRYLKNKTGLHVHHISGVKSDNSPNNLKVLCKDCHAEQPNHQHMRRQ